MTELKVVCDCGQKYKFDVEPVGGQMSFAVACPICGRDGTAKANAMLEQMTVFKPVESAPAAAPAPIAPAIPPPPPSRLRIGSSANAESHAAPAAAAHAAAPSTIGSLSRKTAAAPVDASRKPPSFAMGLLGGFLGALIGSVIYYAIFKVTGYRIGLLSIGVGGLAGWSANFLGRGEGSKELGGITAVLVLAGIVGAQYLVALGLWHQIVRDIEDAGYTQSVNEAKQVVKAVPTGSDAEIRMYLARQSVEENDVAKPASVSNDAVEKFRQKDLPEYQNLASGTETKEQYLAKNGFDSDKLKKFQDTQESTFKSVFLLLLMSKLGIISLIAGAGLAFKLSTNARGD